MAPALNSQSSDVLHEVDISNVNYFLPDESTVSSIKNAGAIRYASSDEFEDAKEDEEVEGGDVFSVTKEELSIIRAELASEFPEDYNYLSDGYILSVASKPYSKDPTLRRPLEYSQQKLNDVMKWRESEGAVDIPDLVALANIAETSAQAVESPDRLVSARALATSLNTGSIYFHGMTKEGKPVMWIRTNRKPWYPDVDADVNALILLSDVGIRCMPQGITDFVVIADSSSPPPPNPSFMIKMLKALVKGYPDRLALLCSAPVSSIVQFVMNLLLPLMPGRLASKVVLLDIESMKTKLTDLMENGADDIPNFFGGTCDHDALYPDEGKSPNRGQGSLKFDYFGMVERLEEAKADWEAKHGMAANSRF